MSELYDQILDSYRRVVNLWHVLFEHTVEDQKEANKMIRESFQRMTTQGTPREQQIITVQNTIIQGLTDFVIQARRDYAEGKREHNFTFDRWIV